MGKMKRISASFVDEFIARLVRKLSPGTLILYFNTNGLVFMHGRGGQVQVRGRRGKKGPSTWPVPSSIQDPSGDV